jgi:hypothetical protein
MGKITLSERVKCSIGKTTKQKILGILIAKM